MQTERLEGERPVAYLVGGAIYSPVDFNPVGDSVENEIEFVPLPLEHKGFSYSHFQQQQDAPAAWDTALLKNHSTKIEEHRRAHRSRTSGVIAHCSGSYRALALLEKHDLDFAVLINPPSKGSDISKLLTMGRAPRAHYLSDDNHRAMLHPLTQNYDVQRWNRWVAGQLLRLYYDAAVYDAYKAEDTLLRRNKPIVDCVRNVAERTGKNIWMLRDPNDPWDCGEVKNPPANVRQGEFPNGGHYLHVFHPELVIAYLRNEVLGKITKASPQLLTTPRSSPVVPQHISPS